VRVEVQRAVKIGRAATMSRRRAAAHRDRAEIRRGLDRARPLGAIAAGPPRRPRGRRAGFQHVNGRGVLRIGLPRRAHRLFGEHASPPRSGRERGNSAARPRKAPAPPRPAGWREPPGSRSAVNALTPLWRWRPPRRGDWTIPAWSERTRRNENTSGRCAKRDRRDVLYAPRPALRRSKKAARP